VAADAAATVADFETAPAARPHENPPLIRTKNGVVEAMRPVPTGPDHSRRACRRSWTSLTSGSYRSTPRRPSVDILGISLLAIATLPITPVNAQDLDPALTTYRRASGEVAGSLKCVGSDTMNNLVALWSEGFKKHYPSVREAIEGKGSASGPPALTEGTCTFSPMSRDWRPSEIDAFKAKHGYPPVVIPAAIDMLAVYVHKDNPLESLSLQQVDAIFSKNRNGGAPAEFRTWGDLGLGGAWKDRPISLYGRNATSGTYGYFKEHALFQGDFKPTVKEQPGSSAVVQAVASDVAGIGYSGIGYRTAGVKALPLAARPGATPTGPEAVNAYTGEYPLARFLYLCVNSKPDTRLDPLRREFLRYVLSASGQADVRKDGYLPITAAIAERALVAAGVEPTRASGPRPID
jgi:phosphate transport system substrate-binding protein